jgi:ESS family glutamate:Na+ symporter
MWLGSYVSKGIEQLGFTFPAYIGAMLVAAVIRNIDDYSGWFGLSHRVLDSIGAIALSLFLAMAMMDLRLWEIATLAFPLVIGLVLQVLLVTAAAVFVFRCMGRDYEASVMSGGFIGFMLGTTANAMAVMRALVERHGVAPRAFLVAPLVGAFFIDVVNNFIITVFMNIFR